MNLDFSFQNQVISLECMTLCKHRKEWLEILMGMLRMLYSDHLQLKQQQRRSAGHTDGQVTIDLGLIYEIIKVLLKNKFHYSA